MFGVYSASIDGVSVWTSPGVASTSRASGSSSSLSTSSASGPMTTTIFGCTIAISSTSRATHSGAASAVSAHRALHAQRAVDGERIDVEPLERLHQRGPRATVEGDALFDLRRRRCVLEQQHVGLRMAGAEHGHEAAARAAVTGLQVAGEVVELADRALEVLLADLVVGCGHPADRFRRAALFSLPLHRSLRVATGDGTAHAPPSDWPRGRPPGSLASPGT